MDTPIPDSTLILRRDESGVSLIGKDMVLQGDFTRMAPRIKQGKLQHELLVKAAKVKGVQGIPTAIDATAGLGEDALLLAAAGFQVTLFERDPVIAALLEDAILRARMDAALAPIAQRMHLHKEDSITGLAKLGFTPDIILLDPMFPAKRKDALTNKKLQLFQQLESPCPDEHQLLDAALAAKPRKIVIKRPLKGPYLAERKPSHSLTGKTVRYDCIVL